MKKSLFRIALSKLLYVILFVSIQVAALVVMFLFFQEKFAYFYAVCILFSLAAALHIINSERNPAYKIAWLIPLLLVPIFGGPLYAIFGKIHPKRREIQKFRQVLRQTAEALRDDNAGLEQLSQVVPEALPHVRYIQTAAAVPPYCHTDTQYYPLGEEMFAAMCQELEGAKRFIFLEYFIIHEGTMWNTMLEILERKAREGVEVRVMFDDVGSLLTLPRHYERQLRQKGIQACVFNPFHSILSSRFNNRDHRKICVVDGTVGFTGGINLADEYINAVEVHGHWKDGGVRLRGDAVWSLTVMFLAMWDFVCGKSEDFSRFRGDPQVLSAVFPDGFVQPYTDMPLDRENVGENVYLNLINRAQTSICITTPYLILDNETITALQTAAKSGVDVQIITPYVPDKKYVQFLTRSNYEALLRDGVRIYEYTPGFIHMKNCICDSKYAVVGTINFDYRSLYLHFECAAWMCNSKAVGQVQEDFEQTLALSREVTLDSMQQLGFFKRLLLSVLRVFSPLF